MLVPLIWDQHLVANYVFLIFKIQIEAEVLLANTLASTLLASTLIQSCKFNRNVCH